MLVILTDEQILSPQQVCHGCLLANKSGLPRWHQGTLRCGHALNKRKENQPEIYECEMGFRIAQID